LTNLTYRLNGRLITRSITAKYAAEICLDINSSFSLAVNTSTALIAFRLWLLRKFLKDKWVIFYAHSMAVANKLMIGTSEIWVLVKLTEKGTSSYRLITQLLIWMMSVGALYQVAVQLQILIERKTQAGASTASFISA